MINSFLIDLDCLYVTQLFSLLTKISRMYLVNDQFFSYLVGLRVARLYIIVLTQLAIIGSGYTRPGGGLRCT